MKYSFLPRTMWLVFHGSFQKQLSSITHLNSKLLMRKAKMAYRTILSTIPEFDRVIAVADSIDAMMSNRSYRCSMSSEKCRREIEKNTGVMYDPKIAKTALESWNLVLKSRNGHHAGSLFSACAIGKEE